MLILTPMQEKIIATLYATIMTAIFIFLLALRDWDCAIDPMMCAGGLK